MPVTPNIDAQLFKEIHTATKLGFRSGLQSEEKVYQELSKTIKTKGRFVRTPSIGDVARMRKWEGPRRRKTLSVNNENIEIETFENTAALDVNDVLDDRDFGLGLYSDVAKRLGIESAMLPQDEIFKLWAEGLTRETYDSEPFFSANHPITPDGSVPGVQSNFFPGLALDETNFNEAVKNFALMKNEEGNLLGLRAQYLIVPQAMRADAKQIVDRKFHESGSSNINDGEVKLMILPQLDTISQTAWYVADLRRMKPFIVAENMSPQMRMKGFDSEYAFDNDTIELGVKARYGFGYNNWKTLARYGG